MKKILVSLISILVCASLFAGAFSLSLLAGYDTNNFGINVKNLKFKAEISYDDEKEVITEEVLDKELDGEEYTERDLIMGYVKNANISFEGPSAGLKADYKVNDEWSVFAEASYIYPTTIRIRAAKLLSEYGWEAEDKIDIANANVTIRRAKLDNLIDFILDEDEMPEEAELKIDYKLNGAKARVGAEYAYACKTLPVELTATVATECGLTLLSFDTEFNFIEDIEASGKINLLSCGLAAGIGANYDFGKKLSVGFDALCDANIFNAVKGSITMYETEYDVKAYSFCFTPAFAVRAAVKYAF